MIYTEKELVDRAKERADIPNAEVEARAFYWYIRCIIADFQLGRIDKEESERLKADAISTFSADERISCFRKSELAHLADSWCKVETLVEEYNHHKSLATADKILECLYPTNGEVIE